MGTKAENTKMQEILSKFHFWFPFPLQDHEEPADPELRPYDAHYMEPEGDAEYEAAKGAHLKKYNQRVKAWIKARVVPVVTKGKESKKSSSSPFNDLMARLANKSKPIRARSAQQQWQSANWLTGMMVEASVLKEWEEKTGFTVAAVGSRELHIDNGTNNEDDVDKNDDDDGNGNDDKGGAAQTSTREIDGRPPYPGIKFVSSVVGRMFKALPVEEQERWRADAQEEARLEKEEYQAMLARPVQADPTTRATCVRNAPEFLSQINRGVEISSSLRLTTLAAGPMARKKGDVGFFMVTTSTNRAVVPMSFQEWYGEERTKALMESYKEWVESCLSPNEVQEVMGIGEGSTGQYTGVLGKGFTTDDTPLSEPQTRPAVQPSIIRPEDAVGMQQGQAKGKAKEVVVEKARPLRKKAGDQSSDDTSSSESDDGLDEWSGKSSSEDEADRAMPWDDEERSAPAPPGSAMERLDKGLKALRHDWVEKEQARKRKRAERALEKPSRRSKRMRNEQAVFDEGDPGGIEGSRGRDEATPNPLPTVLDIDSPPHSDSASMVANKDTPANAGPIDEDSHGAPVDEEAPVDGNPPAHGSPPADEDAPVEGSPPADEEAPVDDDAPVDDNAPVEGSPPADEEAPVDDDAPVEGSPPVDENAPNEGNPPVDESTGTNSDNAVRELIIHLSPETKLGLERGVLDVAAGIGSVAGMVLCGRRGLDFLLLPFNEFFQAPGGNRLKRMLELLIAIETCLLRGYMSDVGGRKKAVVPVGTRPGVLSSWIMKGRCRVGRLGNPAARIVIPQSDVKQFAKTWHIWWSALQPGWRVKAGGYSWAQTTYGDDWHTMIIPGQNGLLSVVVTLSWWGSAAMSGDERADWAEAVTDVEWMMIGLLNFLEIRKT